MKKLRYLLIPLFLLTILAGCKRSYGEDEMFDNGSNVKFVNVAANSTAVPLKINNNNVTLIDQNLFFSSSSYYRTTNGTHVFDFLTNLSGTESKKVLSFSDNLEINKSATYYILNPNATSSDLIFVKSNDDVTLPDYNVSKIRFANFCYDSTNIDVIMGGTANPAGIVSGGTVVATNMAFKDVTAFFSTPTKNTSFQIVKTGTNILIKNTSTVKSNFSVSLKSKGVSTFILAGYINPTTSQPGLAGNSFTNSL